MTEQTPLQTPAMMPPACEGCAHLLDFADVGGLIRPRCRAFPAGVPNSVMYGEVDHRSPIDGDRGIQFAARTAPTANAEEMKAFRSAEADGSLPELLLSRL